MAEIQFYLKHKIKITKETNPHVVHIVYKRELIPTGPPHRPTQRKFKNDEPHIATFANAILNATSIPT